MAGDGECLGEKICKMNEAYLQLSDKKERIVLAENRLAHEGMGHISEMMASLQQSLQKRHEVLAANMDPICQDSSLVPNP